jgi:hypothetical protein
MCLFIKLISSIDPNIITLCLLLNNHCRGHNLHSQWWQISCHFTAVFILWCCIIHSSFPQNELLKHVKGSCQFHLTCLQNLCYCNRLKNKVLVLMSLVDTRTLWGFQHHYLLHAHVGWNIVVIILMYIPCILYSLLFIPTNVQHIYI